MKRIKTLAGSFIFLLIIGIGVLIIILSNSDAISTRPKLSGMYHKVSKGETVWALARRYKISMQAILKANRIRNPRKDVKIGTKLFIPGAKQISSPNGISYRVRSGDTVWGIAERHKIPRSDIMRANKLPSSGKIFAGQKLFLPGVSKTLVDFGSPLRAKSVVTSGYGYRRHPIHRRRIFHHGVDLRAKSGTRVYAAESGKVIFVGWLGGYGKLVIVKHDNNNQYTTRYGHLSRIKVHHGQKVKRGTVIGLSGSTGYATGPHLHFEVRYKGKSANPMKYIRI